MKTRLQTEMTNMSKNVKRIKISAAQKRNYLKSKDDEEKMQDKHTEEIKYNVNLDKSEAT